MRAYSATVDQEDKEQCDETMDAWPKWGNSISSIVILAGRWDFFDEEKLQGPKVELGPGIYLHVKDHGIKDNSISSIRLVSPRGR